MRPNHPHRTRKAGRDAERIGRLGEVDRSPGTFSPAKDKQHRAAQRGADGAPTLLLTSDLKEVS